jgi:hypothetical protein
MATPHHQTESRDDRKKARELQEARAAGTAAPAVDASSGQIINPHNPEFLTKKPWYLGGDTAAPTLEHQTVGEREEGVTLSRADEAARGERERLRAKMKKTAKTGRGYAKGDWVEALKRGKRPYLMAKVTSVSSDGLLSLEFEDGGSEKRVDPKNGRVKVTRTGARTSVQDGKLGKQSYDGKRDAYHG